MCFLNFDLGGCSPAAPHPPTLGWTVFPIVNFCASYDYQIEHRLLPYTILADWSSGVKYGVRL